MLYQPLFLGFTFIWAVLYGFRCLSSPDYSIQMTRTNLMLPFLVSIILVFWLGYRPVSGVFGDTVNYAFSYSTILPSADIHPSLESEWMWFALMVICKWIGCDINGFFTVIEAGYILSVLWAVKRFMPTNPVLGILFVFTSLMFFTFGTNGLRNGLACHFILLAMSFFFADKYLPGALFCILAFGIHRSVMLPIAGMFVGRFVLTNLKYAIYFWFVSILLSLTFGNTFIDFFPTLDLTTDCPHTIQQLIALRFHR